MLYPLKFYPIYKEKIWGGSKIKKLKNDPNVPNNCGESWEISGLEDNVSIISNGFLKDNSLEEIIEIYMEDIVGEKVFEKYGIYFPILFKIIESNDNLSLQVHPDDKTALERYGENGKNEAWYILEAEACATLTSGFKKDVNFDILQKAIENQNLEDILNIVNVKPGEVYHIPAGRIHSLGKGVLLAEVQQSSDRTYRVYDYGRTGRELHIEDAKDVIDYKKTTNIKTEYKIATDNSTKILDTDSFKLNYLSVFNKIQKDYYSLDSFVILYCIKGSLGIQSKSTITPLKAGETVLLPAALNSITLLPDTYTELLEIHL